MANRRLVAAGLLVERDNGYEFSQDLIRSTIAAGADAERRAAVHRAAYAYFRDAMAMDGDTRLAHAAHHAVEAGQSGEGGQLCAELGDRYRHRHAYLDAEAAYSRALPLIRRSEAESYIRQLEIVRRRGEMRYRLGRFEDACSDQEAALAQAIEIGDHRLAAHLRLDLATTLDWMREYRRSSEVWLPLVEPEVAVEDSLLRARLHLARGRSLWRFEDWEAAADELRQASDMASTQGDAGYETYVIAHLLLGIILAARGRIEDAERDYAATVDLCRERGDLVHLAVAVMNRCFVWLAKRDSQRLLGDLYEARRLLRETGTGHDFVCELNLGEQLVHLGRHAEAHAHIDRAVAFQRRRHGDRTAPVALLLRARALLLEGRRSRARQILADIAAVQKGAGPECAFRPVKALHHQMIERSHPGASIADWDQLCEAADTTTSDGIEVYVARGLWHQERGELEECHCWLERARDLTASVPTLLGVSIETLLGRRAERRQRSLTQGSRLA